MKIEFIGEPQIQICGNVVSEKVEMVTTRDDGTTVVGEARAILMEVGELIVETYMTSQAGQVDLTLTTFKTLNVMDGEKVGKEINSALQTQEGEVVAFRDYMAVEPVALKTKEDVARFVESAVEETRSQVAENQATSARNQSGGSSEVPVGVDSIALAACLAVFKNPTACARVAAKVSARAGRRFCDPKQIVA
jgi:hypothetical protein